MKVKGEVITEVEHAKNTSRYRILHAEGECRIVSEGEQAVHDYLFVRKGQQMEIEGELKKEELHSQKAKIVLD